MMTADNSQKERLLEKTVRSARRVGWWFLVLGGGMLVLCLFTLFDPEDTIRVNGVETHDFGTKFGVAAFAAIFPAVGSLLAFLPQKKIMRLLGHIYDRVETSRTTGMKK